MEDEIYRTLAKIRENIKTIMQARRFTIPWLAETAEIGEQRLRDILEGRDDSLDTDECIRVACAMDVPLFWVFLPEDMLRTKLSVQRVQNRRGTTDHPDE